MIQSISGTNPTATQSVSSNAPAPAPKASDSDGDHDGSKAASGSKIGPAVIVSLSKPNDAAQGDPDHDGH